MYTPLGVPRFMYILLLPAATIARARLRRPPLALCLPSRWALAGSALWIPIFLAHLANLINITLCIALRTLTLKCKYSLCKYSLT